MKIRLVQHEESFEVRFPDGRESRYFYFDENAGRRAVSGRMTKDRALQEAQALARVERGRLERVMHVWIYVDTSKQVGDMDHLKVFPTEEVARQWFDENDREGVAFRYEVIQSRTE